MMRTSPAPWALPPEPGEPLPHWRDRAVPTITTARTVLRLLRATIGLALVIAGLGLLLPAPVLERLFARADVADPVRWVSGLLLLGNGALLLFPELAFVGTLVPTALASMLLVMAIRAGAWGIALCTFGVLLGLLAIMWMACPPGLRRVAKAPVSAQPRDTPSMPGWSETAA